MNMSYAYFTTIFTTMQTLSGIKPETTRSVSVNLGPSQTASGKGFVAIRRFATILCYTKVNPTPILLSRKTLPSHSMYFWRIEKLKTQMAARPLTDREALPYLVVYVTLSAIVCCFPLAISNVWDALGGAWTAILAVIGTIYIYRQNGGADGQHFLQRYLAIGWVVTLRWLVVIVVCAIPIIVVVEVVGATMDATTWYEFFFIGIAETIIYWRIGHHVRDLSQRSTAA